MSIKSLWTTLVFSLCLSIVTGQDMDLQKMDEIIHSVGDSVLSINGVWQFKYEETYMMIMTDEKYNRMRIISPVTEQTNLSDEQLIKLLEANYHSALDTKYALSDGILWAVFIHPLRELNKNQLVNALSQVHQTAITFGSTYSSTGLMFGGQSLEDRINPGKKN